MPKAESSAAVTSGCGNWGIDKRSAESDEPIHFDGDAVCEPATNYSLNQKDEKALAKNKAFAAGGVEGGRTILMNEPH